MEPEAGANSMHGSEDGITRREWLWAGGAGLLGVAALSRTALRAEDRAASGGQSLVQAIEPDPATGTSAAVLVRRAPLAHTKQMLSVAARGTAARPFAAQLKDVLEQVQSALEVAGTGLENTVRLHVALARSDLAREAGRELRAQLPPNCRPAVTWVTSAQPHPGALVAMDAVAAVPGEQPKSVVHHGEDEPGQQARMARVSLLPAGRAVYISGQAEAGENLAEATRKTLDSLRGTLEFLKLDRSHVAQVKCFLKPMADVQRVEEELGTFFGDQPVPATVHVEWTLSSPIEIEMVAWAPEGTAPQASGPIAFITPPGMKPSPVFSRIAVIDGERTLYTAGLSAVNGGVAAQEVRQIFDRLGGILKAAGSDFRHLAKATYYVADDEVSRALNELRPEFYDPERPPAASKAGVAGVGDPDSRITLDLIAVPATSR